jgi:ubiquinone/menaquinone biosynthesis C-methylase UbiE
MHRLVELAHIPEDASVLDVGTGAGAAAFTPANETGTTGRVIRLDIAGDNEHLNFSDATFDAVLCASSLFLLPDIPAALKEWRRVTRPGGAVAFSSYGEDAFQPLSNLYEARCRRYGLSVAAPFRPFWWQRLTDPETCHDLLRDAGFQNIEVRIEQLGYRLQTIDEWWDIVWSNGFHGPASQLSLDRLVQFKAEHLAEVGALVAANDSGIWLNVPAIFAVGRVA